MSFSRERLFSPLGMSDTGFVVPESDVARYAKALPNDPLTGEPQTIRDGTRLLQVRLRRRLRGIDCA